MPPTQGQRRLRWSSGAVFLIGAFIILFIYHGFVGWYHATRSHAARAVAEQQAKGRAIPKLLLQQHGDQTIKDIPSAAAALDARLSAAAASRAAIRLAPPVTALNQPVPLPPGIKLPDSVLVALMTGHFFGDYEGDTPCTLEGKPLKCTYTTNNKHVYAKADALWYHLPGAGGTVNKHHPSQLTIGMSMESDKYYSNIADKTFMRNFDLEMTYRECSQVPVFYFDYHNTTGLKPHIDDLFTPAKPYGEKKNGIAYVNSNCGALSGRTEIMRSIMNLNDSVVPVHSYGRCDRNMDVPGDFNKVELIHGYKFCVAMENSITKDYITEKLWQALEAGCIPIYLGPHNAKYYLPDPDAILLYSDYGTPAKLMEAVRAIANNQTEYERRIAWKKRSWNKLQPSFLAFTQRTHVHQPHTRCQMCRLLAYHKVQPQKYTTCMFNATWLKGSGYE